MLLISGFYLGLSQLGCSEIWLFPRLTWLKLSPSHPWEEGTAPCQCCSGEMGLRRQYSAFPHWFWKEWTYRLRVEVEGWGRKKGLVGGGGEAKKEGWKGQIQRKNLHLLYFPGFSIFISGLYTPGCPDLAVYTWLLSLYLGRHLASPARAPIPPGAQWGPMVAGDCWSGWVSWLLMGKSVPCFSCTVLFHEHNKTRRIRLPGSPS